MQTAWAHRIIALLLLAQWAGSGSARAGEPPQPGHKPTRELVEMLGSESFREREYASEMLLSRHDALPHVRRALSSSNAEVRRRAKAILEVIAVQPLEQYLDYGRNGRIDLLVEWLGKCEVAVDRMKFWPVVIDISSEILKRARPELSMQRGWRYNAYPGSSYKDFLKARPRFIGDQDLPGTARQPVFLTVRHKGELTGEGIDVSLVACAGSVHLDRNILGSIVFGAGAVSADRSLAHSVVVADGDVQAWVCDKAVIIARNNVRIKHVASDQCRSIVLAGGRVEIESFSHNNQRVPFNIRTSVLEGSEIKEGVKKPLDFVRFFETSDVGVEIATAESAVRIEKLTADSPLAKAGLKVGDVVLSMDGNKTPDAGTFRRQLRRAFVSQEGVFSVRRDQKPLAVTVSFFGFELPKD